MRRLGTLRYTYGNRSALRLAAWNPPEPQVFDSHTVNVPSFLAPSLTFAKAEGRTLENPEALDALELGARRIDFIGAKFQEMDESIAIFNQARAMIDSNTRTREISSMLENVGSNNGKLEDMRDGYTELGELFRRAWLRDNRPYWLDNNLRRYDRAAELWIGRADRWQSQVVQQWRDTHTLPLPEAIGFPAAEDSGPGLAGFPR